MEIINNIVNSKRCVGCGACKNICPSNAISMRLNADGFYQPEINMDKCINCALCDKACPVVNVKYENEKEPECYALMADDKVRARSSSGGAFELLANYVLNNGGKVCGVSYDSDCMKTKHIIIDKKADLDKLRGSKYIMSDTGEVYSQIKELINSKKLVLFSGCPCQVAGLYGYLGKQRSSQYLITVDLICHGIPSVKAFSKYMRDVHGNKKIAHLGFKDKEYGWHASMTIDFVDAGRFNMPCESDYYFKSYLNGLNKNSACGNCVFARLPRQGDITIGDYWGINNYKKEYNDGKGTSVLLFNNEKSRVFIQYLKKVAKLFEPTPLEVAIKGNSNLVSSPSVRISRSQFFKNLDSLHYPELVDWAFATDRFDVGIVGIPIFPNFGGALTYYGLYRTLRDLNYSVALFSRPRSTGRAPIAPEKIYSSNPYDKGALHLDYLDKQAMSTANDWCDTFVVGSDQLFNADLYKSFGEIVALDWVADNHRKIAYAASFGHDYFWGSEKLRAKMSHYMKKFDAFSVREEEGVGLAKKAFGVDAEYVLDPVFLCDKKHYEQLAEQSEKKLNKPHIFAYILDPSSEKEKIIDSCVKKLGLSVELYSEMLYEPTPERVAEEKKKFKYDLLQGNVNERLYSLINSDFVIADSFHGICFAIIFNKPFIAILNKLRGASRFYSVLGKLGLSDRLISCQDDVKSKPYLLDTDMDYSKANALLSQEKDRCIKWLKLAISPEVLVKKSYSSDDILNEKIDVLNRTILKKDIILNGLIVNKKLFNVSDFCDYLGQLILNKNEYIILLSVKDTPGFSFNEKHDSLFHELGLKVSLVNKHWHSYVAVINGEQIVSENLSKTDERVAYAGLVDGILIKNVSRSYNKGNTSAIFVNGNDYSENKRGVNIVVIDKLIGKVIDSVCFDTHDPDIKCYRFGTRSVINIISDVLKDNTTGTEIVSNTEKKASSITPPVVTINTDSKISDAVEKVSTILPEHEILTHGAYYAGGFGGSFVDYFVDKGIREISIYGNDMLAGLLYEQAYARGLRIVGLYGDRKVDVAIRFPKVGFIHLEDIKNINPAIMNTPIVVADSGYPADILNLMRNGVKAYKITELNYYSIVKNSLFDPVLNYVKDHPGLKVCALNMTRAYEVKNPSEIEKSIMSNQRNIGEIFQKLYKDYGYFKEYIDSVISPIKVKSIGGVDFINDEVNKYRNCLNGYRSTVGVPAEFTNTIYVFGNSVAFGVGADDEHTIESTLQKELNLYYNGNSPFAVLNCANGGSVNTLAQYNSFKFHAPSSGDMVVLCMGFGKLLSEVYKEKMTWVDTSQLFARPHNLGEIFYDNDHMNNIGYEVCGKELARVLISNGMPTKEELIKLSNSKFNEPKMQLNVALSSDEEKELNAYLSEIASYKKGSNGRIGAIVMNCNPFTLGHRYLIESSAAKCDVLYIFVVQEDRSMFPFADRIELVKKGVADLKNVIVLPSGKFIISQTTFQAYFTKEEKNDVVIDASNDINIFSSYIAPALGITVRFAGEEPLDNVTNQYNATMKRLLPRAGIDFEVIKRKEEGGAPISASRVRALLKEKKFEEIAKITPKTTFEYLYNKYKNSKNVLVLGGTRFMGIRLVEKLLEQDNFVTIATRGIHPDPFGKKVTRVKIDRLKEDTMIAAFKGKHYDVVYDTTAYCSNAVKYALSHINCDRYIQVSSVAIYGTKEILKREEQFDPTVEKFELCDSMENYGIGKRYAECAAYQLFPNISKAIVRVPFVVEPDNINNKELNLRLYFYAKHIVKGIPMTLDNLDLVCSFVRTTDEAEFLIKIANSNFNGVVNLSSEGTATIGEIVEYLENTSGKKAIIDPNGDMHPFNALHFKVGVAFDLEKAKSIGYKPPKLKDWLWPLLAKYIDELNNKD